MRLSSATGSITRDQYRNLPYVAMLEPQELGPDAASL